MINEKKYTISDNEETLLQNANSGANNSVFLNTNPSTFFDKNTSQINTNFFWDFAKKHPKLDIKKVENILDNGCDVVDQHCPFFYVLAEYNDSTYNTLLILKFNPWRDDDENYFKISLTSTLKEAINLLEQESKYVYSNSFDVDVTWDEVKEKLLAYDEAKQISKKIEVPTTKPMKSKL